jgi:hypothetical protein
MSRGYGARDAPRSSAAATYGCDAEVREAGPALLPANKTGGNFDAAAPQFAMNALSAA